MKTQSFSGNLRKTLTVLFLFTFILTANSYFGIESPQLSTSQNTLIDLNEDKKKPANLIISKIEILPKKPESGEAFTIKIWAKNNGDESSESFKLWVTVEQYPKPGTDQKTKYYTKDHGNGLPIVVNGIQANSEVLIYHRNDWLVNNPQLHAVVVEIEKFDEKIEQYETW